MSRHSDLEIKELTKKLLLRLENTDPDLGDKSENCKYDQALEAIDIWWQLSSHLVGWAHNQIVGYEMYRDNDEVLKSLQSIVGTELTADSHILEYLGRFYNKEYLPNNEDCEQRFVSTMNQLEDQVEDLQLSNSATRKAIGKIFWSQDFTMSAVRYRILKAAQIVDHGGKSELFTREKHARNNKPFTYDEVRAQVLCHYFYKVAKGVKKYVVREEIADFMCISVETLRTWEKDLGKHDWFRFWWGAASAAGEYETEILSDETPDGALAHVAESWGDLPNIYLANVFITEHKLGWLSLEKLKKKYDKLKQENVK